MKGVFLGIGSNLGKRDDNILEAIKKIRELIGPVVNSSSVYETKPWGFRSKNDFLNMVIEVDTKLKPSGLLGRLLMIESLLGRVRKGKKYTSRIIDIDILLYNDMVMENEVLVIPHPRMHERKFVLVPLCEIAPDFMHPLLKKSISELLKECPDKSKIRLQDLKSAS
ncbi:MAG: dihydroneopterin aldolase / 2-amino-4-hydroxy-6-hydroxymethyldihydropteridine diphosphokinase [Bacteroidota bacterium]|nr:dihydroneopterin aldolase / 2-amino-4-hydroxy-6-hydroxymethyldihydropteridine diphosphokinase [Bacteroidota bacterium]